MRIKASQPERFANAPKSHVETIGAFAKGCQRNTLKLLQVLGRPGGTSGRRSKLMHKLLKKYGFVPDEPCGNLGEGVKKAA